MKTIIALTTLSILVFLLVVIIACGDSDSSQGVVQPSTQESHMSSTTSPLKDSDWILSEINGKSIDQTCRSELHFHEIEGNHVSHHSCCNNFGAKYEIGQESFSIIKDTFNRNRFASGQRDCTETIIQQETDYFEAILNTTAYRYSEDELEFFNTDGETVLAFYLKPEPLIDTNLINTQWNLINYDDILPLEGTNITIGFDDKSIVGHSGLNTYGVTLIQAHNGVILFDGPLISTAIGGPKDRELQERAYLDMLNNAANYQIIGDNLEITTTNDEIFLYEQDPEGFRYPSSS